MRCKILKCEAQSWTTGRSVEKQIFFMRFLNQTDDLSHTHLSEKPGRAKIMALCYMLRMHDCVCKVVFNET